MKRTSKRVMAVAVSLAMVLTGSTSALAATTNPEISDREIEHKTAAKNIAAQGMVLLENKNNSLPISKEKGAKIALFGQGVYNTIKAIIECFVFPCESIEEEELCAFFDESNKDCG